MKEAQKIRIILEFLEGRSVRSLARAYKVPVSTIEYIIRVWDHGGYKEWGKP